MGFIRYARPGEFAARSKIGLAVIFAAAGSVAAVRSEAAARIFLTAPGTGPHPWQARS
jgi:hypothetical protein